MLQEGLHIHLKHNIEGIFVICHVENWFSHEAVQLADVVHGIQVSGYGGLDVLFYLPALGGEREDLLVVDPPHDPLDEEGYFDSVELVQDGVHFGVFDVCKEVEVDINDLVEL